MLEFDLSAPTSVVNIQEKTGENVISIDRLVLVPAAQWSPDLVTPASRCVRDPRTAACVTPRLPYPPPPDESVISVPQQILDGYPARNLPRGIDDQSKQLVYINNLNPEVDLHSTYIHNHTMHVLVRTLEGFLCNSMYNVVSVVMYGNILSCLEP